jgi:transaldolase/glucose-6-phosphate isomerase
LAAPEKYGNDRCFVYLRFEGDENQALDRQVAALQANGHPVARIDLSDKNDLGQEFFRWEFAVAAAGAVIGIHPFNQPDVQLAKDLAKKAMESAGSSKRGRKPREQVAAADGDALRDGVALWLAKKKPRDYVAVQAYLDPSADHTERLKGICALIQERLGAATTLGFGPGFLHSTGQLHKGGPNSVLVDFAALKQRRRRILRVDLGNDTTGGVNLLAETLRS